MISLRAIHAGEILREEFLKELNITPENLSKYSGIPLNDIEGILEEKKDISVKNAILLSKFFGTSKLYWNRLQEHYNNKSNSGSTKWIKK